MTESEFTLSDGPHPWVLEVDANAYPPERESKGFIQLVIDSLDAEGPHVRMEIMLTHADATGIAAALLAAVHDHQEKR